MRKLSSFLVLLGLCAMPALAAAATYENVPVVDVTPPTLTPTPAPAHSNAPRVVSAS
jgi:hypothetical protein